MEISGRILYQSTELLIVMRGDKSVKCLTDRLRREKLLNVG